VQKALVYAAYSLMMVIFSRGSAALADDLEKDLAREVLKSKTIVSAAQKKVDSAGTTTDEIAKLKASADSVRACYLLLQERFKNQREITSALGGKAVTRHDAVTGGILKALSDYLALIDAIPPDNTVSAATLDRLQTLLDALAPPKKRPILGTLPYKNLGYPATEPNSETSITPAYLGGNQAVRPEDTQSAPEAPISPEIAELAKTLKWNPVLIYEWVKNNVETEWYWGSMKGAEETLHQKSGNDADQAALLVALLRASNFPTRYVRGTIQFFPGIEKVKNLTGIDDPLKIAAFFQKAGIPFKPVIAGGGIANFQIEHVWVESQIPYSNYRGAVIDDMGKTWLALDTSIKPPGYSYNTPLVVIPEFPLSSLRDDYLAALQTEAPLDYLKGKAEAFLNIQHPGKTWQDTVSSRVLIPQVLNILPDTLQFKQIAISNEYTTLPDGLKHQVKFTAADSANNELYTITLDASRLSNRVVTLSYEPESVEDQQIIDSFDGLDNTPSYLVRLRPVLKVDGERLIVAQDGLPMGGDYSLTIELISPNGTEKTVSSQIVGNLSVIGIVSQRSTKDTKIVESDDAESILFKEANAYVQRWNEAEEGLASFLKLSVSRPVPTVAILGGVIDVTWLLDVPHGFEWKGVFIDAALRRVETVTRTGDASREKSFMQLSALQGSILENRIFEDDFKVDAVSTAKLLTLANSGTVPVITIDQTNIDTILAPLPFDDAVKADITNAVNQNLTVKIPQAEMTYLDWTGIGYLKENPETGESGWMLSGQIAGGMTAWGAYRWNDPVAQMIAAKLQNPFSEPPNTDPQAAAFIGKISATDRQEGTAGKELSKPLQVMVLDADKKPVQGADVTFNIRAGGGTFGSDATTIVVKTDGKGIASTRFTLGKKTADNPIFWLEAGKIYNTQVGENIIYVTLPNGTSTVTPFSAYGFPDTPYRMRAINDNWPRNILSYAGPATVVIEDVNGNPNANIPVAFNAGEVTSSCSGTATSHAWLVSPDNACLYNIPVTGECAGSLSSLEILTSGNGSASVGVLMGTAAGASYPITVAGAGFTQTFAFTTYSFGNDCGGVKDPGIELIGMYTYPVDIYGNNINAGNVGASIPVAARIYYLREGETQKQISTSCSTSCNKIVGDRTFSIDTNFATSGITFAGQEGVSKGGGLFTGTYTLQPGVNTIQLVGKAGIDRNLTQLCPACAAVSQHLANQVTTAITVYGVDIQIEPQPFIVVDPDGYSLKDQVISYSITPVEYQAGTAYVILYKDGEPIVYIPSETKGTGTATILKGFKFYLKGKYEAEVVLNQSTGVEIRSGRVPVTIGGVLVPDYNHDGKIDAEDQQRAVKEDTYYFWINDDNDAGETEGADIPGSSSPNWADDKINGVRDLVDFFPVSLDLKGYMNSFDPGTYKCILRSEQGSMIFAYTDLVRSQSGYYLTDVDTARVLGDDTPANETFQIPPEGVELDPGFLDEIRNIDGAGVILLEGRVAVKEPLILDIVDSTNTKVFTLRLNVSLDGVEKMFRHKNLTMDGVLDEEPARQNVQDFAPGLREENGVVNRLDAPNAPNLENDKNMVFLHGYNVNGKAARGWHAEMFKRMYWSGSKAKFWGVTWYGWRSQLWLPVVGEVAPNYWINVRQALKTAPALKQFLDGLGGNITIAAHSLGNMVVSSAIKDHHAVVDKYYMINAAVPTEAFYKAEPVASEMIDSDWDGYKPSLRASEWHTLFTDNRSQLTWRDYLASDQTIKYYNFYSPGEDVLTGC